MQIADKQRNDCTIAHTNNIDGGGAAGRIEFRSGSPPAQPSDADSGTLLDTITYQATSYGAPTAGVATANGLPLSGTASAGTVGHYREKDSAGVVITQGTVTGTGGGGDFEASTTTWGAGDTINLNTCVYETPQ